jgi:AAA+ superfamily predicted ATPase
MSDISPLDLPLSSTSYSDGPGIPSGCGRILVTPVEKSSTVDYAGSCTKNLRVMMTDKNRDLEGDYLLLAKVALSGRPQDVQLALHRASKRYRTSAPELSNAITTLLRAAPTQASPLRRQAETPLPVDVDSRLHLMRVEERPTLDHDLILHRAVSSQLERILKERNKPEALQKAGLLPTRTALFTGLPGVGKTMAARWMARELGKPLLVLDLAAVMSSFLGRTGVNLRHVLDYAKTLDCVLLLDELDAIAKRRDDKSEIGELKRLVTVLLQQIDDWPASGLLIAATNHEDLLDPAVWRRFESVVSFPLPEAPEISRLVSALLEPGMTGGSDWAKVLGLAMKGRSFSDVERDILAARRSAVVMDTSIDEELLALIRSETRSKPDRIALATVLVESKLLSQRRARELTGISRDTIRSRASQGKSAASRGEKKARLRVVK